jgi:hypothetical protein
MLLRLLAYERHSYRRDCLAGRDLGLYGDILEVIGKRHFGRFRMYALNLAEVLDGSR